VFRLSSQLVRFLDSRANASLARIKKAVNLMHKLSTGKGIHQTIALCLKALAVLQR
jgi:hypothetical protein